MYRDTNDNVVFEHPFPGSLNAEIYKSGEKIAETQMPIAPVAQRFILPLTYRETASDGELEIRWSGLDGLSPFNRVQRVEVVTPLLKLPDLRTLFANSNYADTDLLDLERDVRLIIESHTGQKFGYEKGIKYLTGTGEKRMPLPARLNELYSVTGGPITYFNVSADGWSLYCNWKNWLGIKEMPPEDYIENVTLVGGVIHVPDTYWKKWHRGTAYAVEGEWGYPEVPEKVKEATRILVSDFGSGENLYRDRYLDTIKAGDWNLKYRGGAYRGTGNKRADQLLEEYVRQSMVII